jgi:sec-independent protein translocase protein TatA
MLNTVIASLMPGGGEWIIILIVALLIFGGKKIPELMHGVGKGIRSFKEGMTGTDDPKKEDTK